MSFIRFVGRALFASAFVADGVKKLTKPAEQAEQAAAFTEKAAPLVQRAMPAQYSSYVPEDAQTWVRLTGGLEVLGGGMYALGLGRRLGAGLLTAASLMNVAIAYPEKGTDADEARAAKSKALSHAALLGASIVATQDLQGKPSLKWRAEKSANRASNQASKTGSKVRKEAQKASKKARKQAKKVSKKIDAAVH